MSTSVLTSPIHVGTEMMKWFDHHVKGQRPGSQAGAIWCRAFRIEGGDGVKNAAGKLQAGGTVAGVSRSGRLADARAGAATI